MVKGATVRRRNALKRNRGFARSMRHDSTEAEERLWFFVRNHRLCGWKFRRQVPIGPFIADFVCLEARVIVELDGGQHGEQIEYDLARDAFLASKGFRVLRFWNTDVMNNIDAVLEVVGRSLEGSPSSARSLSSGRASRGPGGAPSPPEGEKGFVS